MIRVLATPFSAARSVLLEGSLAAAAEKLNPIADAGNLWGKILDTVRQDGKQYALTWLERML